MTDLQKAVADLISVHAGPGMGDAFEPLEFANETTGRAFATVISTILNGVVAGDLVSSADAKAAQALVVERAEAECRLIADRFRSRMSGTTLADASYRLAEAEAVDKCADAIRSLADTDGMALLAELRAERDAALAEVAHVHEDRAYIIGANAGWDAAVEQGEASPAVGKAMTRFWKKLAETHNARAEKAEDDRARANAKALASEADRDRLAAANAALEEKVRGLVGAAEQWKAAHISMRDMGTIPVQKFLGMWAERRNGEDALIAVLSAMQPAEGEQG